MDGMQPDVRFGEENDRFDVDNIVQMQNKIYRQQMDEVEEEEDLAVDDGGEESLHRRHKHR